MSYLARILKQSFLLAACGLPLLAHGGGVCEEQSIAARAVSTPADVELFARCAAEFIESHGPEEAYSAFHNDPYWRHGEIYVAVFEVARAAENPLLMVFPPDPSREGSTGVGPIRTFGTDLEDEFHRMLEIVDAGWAYYSFTQPDTGRESYKRSFVVEVDWNGTRAAVLAGIYERDIPGSCHADEVSATVLEADPSEQRLREFVRCAAMMVESKGYFAKDEFEHDPRWSTPSTYAFVLDTMGNQLLTSDRRRLDGVPLHAFGGKAGLARTFHDRDVIWIADTFGETFIYYDGIDPATETMHGRAGMLKRVVAQGVPVLVGASVSVQEDSLGPELSCADRSIHASDVHEPEEVRAFVQCAADYIAVHGPEEARRAFNEDERWKSGPTYAFVKGLVESGVGPVLHIYPQNPPLEGAPRPSELVDEFGSNFDIEHYRMLSVVDSGWSYYSFRNPATGMTEPKISYLKAIDWNGERVVIGAGTYLRDLPGTCHASEVNAAAVEAGPTERNVQELVRCGSLQVESMGRFAGPVLSSDPRWVNGATYIFGWDPRADTAEFSGNPSSFAVSGRLGDALFEGRDGLKIVDIFGEAFWYYNFTNRETGEIGRKVGFVKRVLAHGEPLVVGSGYHLSHEDE